MSPEQCRGLNDEVDGATDIYALGCILFEMLCGRAPYISPGWGDVLMMHMCDDIPVPSTDNPRVPPAMDKVVRTALAKKKADRFANMRDMHRALAQSRNDVQDTPAPVMKTDPQMPAIVLGVDALGRPSGAARVRAAGATPAPAANDAFASQDAPADPAAPRRGVSWSGRDRRWAPSSASRSLCGTRHRRQSRAARRAPAPAAAVPPVMRRLRPREAAGARRPRRPPRFATAADDDAAGPHDGRREGERRRQGDEVKAAKSHHRSVGEKIPSSGRISGGLGRNPRMWSRGAGFPSSWRA